MKSLRKRAIAKAQKRLMRKKKFYIPPFDIGNSMIRLRD